ncbi:GNAT family N-acetyltransferase [Agromyces badenianii]|uniref:GNAT family N-acetyltransferase n=1 Tax=Agromyces badenianii TaxID=2080742 RepID=UPI000D59241D|nr:GNAT family N-acetyltransferase [Agromyces badenianii]PWC02858.1 GNAT family N-acetyltransferase [Agromyces badenianii]
MMTDVTEDLDPAPLRVVPAGEVPFAEVEAVFGTRGDPAHCWCQWYKIPGSDWRATGDEDLHDRLRLQMQAPGAGPGLLAYDGETPVGWCAVEPRSALVRLRRSRIVAGGTPHPDFDDPDIWSVSCFVVPRAYRRRGVGRALTEAAVEYARSRGAGLLEGYAVDPSARAKTSADALFHGTVTMFEGAGFTEVARPTADRAIMQRRLRD